MIKKLSTITFITLWVSFSGISCSESNEATMLVLKDKITSQIQNTIGKGDIAIKKYELKIKKVKDSLIKTKVSRKLLENKIKNKEASLDGISSERSKIIATSVDDMKVFLVQVKDAEEKLEATLKKMVVNFDLIKEKVNALEVRREMMETLATIEQYTNIDSSIGGISTDLDKTIKSIEHDSLKLEAELEVNNVLKNL